MIFNRNQPQLGRINYNKEINNTFIHDNENNVKVQCFPFYSILLALNRTDVDYLSLDIEGDELKVLKTIPFEKVEFKIMTVECNHQKTRGQELRLYLDNKGYQNVTMLHIDMVFMKKP